MTWTVDLADQSVFAYKLIDVDTVIMLWRIINSTLVAPASTFMTILLPNSFTAVRPASSTHIYFDGGSGAEAPGLARIIMADPTHLQLFRTPSVAWTPAVNNVWTEGQIIFGI